MDITTIGCYMMIIPVVFLILFAICGVLWLLVEIVKCTVEAYTEKSCGGMILFFVLWMGIIGVAFIVIGVMT